MTALESLVVEAAPKALVYVGALLALGVGTTRWLIARRAPLGATVRADLDASLARLGIRAAALLIAALALRAWLHTAAAFGWRESVQWPQISTIVLESRWGSGWRGQAAAAAVLFAGGVAIRINKIVGWIVFAAAAIACAVTLPLVGHGAGSVGRMALHALHATGAGVWLGSLACIMALGSSRASLLRLLAPVALTGAGAIATAGGLMVFQYLQSPADLWSTSYGGALSLKLALVGGIVVCGYSNWRAWRAAAADSPSSIRLELAEVILAGAVIVVTAFLGELEHP
jgi:putative copper export protein